MKNSILTITFIVPVYNVQTYLRDCINSIIDVWNGNKEIILVLGNSVDQSSKISEEFQQRYSEVKLVYQDGKGLSNARNCGLKMATGDYIIFVDSDDYVISESLERRLRLIAEAKDEFDLIASDFVSVYEGNKYLKASNQIEKGDFLHYEEEKLVRYLKNNGGIWNVWRYIYRRDFLVKNQFLFEENTKSEDILFTTKSLLGASKIALFHEPYYCYRIRRVGALTVQVDSNYINDLLKMLSFAMHAIDLSSNRIGSELKNKIQREYIFNLANLRNIRDDEKKVMERVYANVVELIRETDKLTYKLCYYLICMGLIDIVVEVMFWIREVRRKLIWRI